MGNTKKLIRFLAILIVLAVIIYFGFLSDKTGEIVESTSLLEKLENLGPAEMVLTTITFDGYISIEDTETMVLEYGVDPHMAYLLEEDSYGEKILSALFSEDDFPFFEEMRNLNRKMENIPEDMPESFKMELDSEVLGVAALIGEVPVQSLIELQEDERIYYTDIFADNRFSINPGNDDYASPLSWEVLNLLK